MNSHNTPDAPNRPRQRRQLAVEVPASFVDRVDDLAAFCGLTRSGFVRLAVSFANATTTLGELRRQEDANPDDEQVATARETVERDLAAITARLAPRRLQVRLPPTSLSDN